jgi:hypothetical protein
VCGLEHRDCDVHTHWLRADLWSALSISSTPAQVTQADPSSRQSRPSLGAVDSVASISGCAWKDHLKQIVCRSVPTGPAGDFPRKCTARREVLGCLAGHWLLRRHSFMQWSLCGQCIESTHSLKKATLLTPRSSRRKHRSGWRMPGECLKWVQQEQLRKPPSWVFRAPRNQEARGQVACAGSQRGLASDRKF